MNTFKVQFFSPDNRISFDEYNYCSNEYQIKEKVVIDNGVLEVVNNDCSILTNQIQVFDHLTHDEESLKNKRVGIYLSYLDVKSL
nr:unnamed protein product [Callosobruchus chinensis]